MESEQKIDLSIKMYNAALESCKTRQVYEWKFCILIWTAIGSIIIALLINKAEICPSVLQLLILGALSVAVIVVVIYFQEKCRLANQVDKRRAEFYENIINASMGIAGPDYSNLNTASIMVSEKIQSFIKDKSRSKRKEVKDAIGLVRPGQQLSRWKKALSLLKLKPRPGEWSRNSQITITIVLLIAFWIICFAILGPKPS